MKYTKAAELMNEGTAVMSKVSKTVYERIGSMLFAEGIRVKDEYLTEAEINGDWKSVRILKTAEDIRNLSDNNSDRIMCNCYERYQYDLKNRKCLSGAI